MKDLPNVLDKSYDSVLIGKLGRVEQRFLSRFGIQIGILSGAFNQ
jgi:hypothetical protein